MEESNHLLIDIPESELDFSNESWKEVVKRDFQEIRNALEKNPDNGSPAYYTWFLFFLKYGRAICSEEGKRYIKEHNTSVFNLVRDAVGLEMTSGGAYTVGYKFYDECIKNSIAIDAAGISIQVRDTAPFANSKVDDLATLQRIFYGAPGTGKSFAIDNLTNDENTVRTTFHPDSDYASFVGAYKPTMEDVPINSIYGESVQFATGKNGHPGTEKKIVYKYVPQAFLKAYVAAWSDLDNPHYLVIEEINRGNCAQIFGDLFQLLDRNSHGSSSYAIHADDDIRQFLSTDSKGFGNLSEEQKQAIADFVLVKDNGKRSEIGPKILSGELLLLPPNLRIWATMNTSDQSLFPIDSAFKRRWNWHYVPIEYDKKDWLLHIGDNYYRWGDFLKAINPIISELTESADKQMGYFFAKPDEKHGETTENNTISEDVFINKVLFYLWTDVLKDFDAGKEPFLNPDTKRAYEFSDFFDAKHDYLEQFVGKLNISPVANEDTESNTANTEEASKRIYGRSLVIKFPDGTVIKGDSQFDSYIQALEKIGLDKAAAVVEKKGYSRNQAPLISKEKHASIENSPTFSYVQNGDYYIIKGIDTMEGTLKGISKELGLNLDVYFE